MNSPKVAILNEHHSWQNELRDKLQKAGVLVYTIAIQDHSFDIHRDEFADFDLVINRASPSAGKRNHRAAILYTLQMIEHFERLGIPVINGSQAYGLEISKARQCQLLRRLNLPFPRTIVVNSAERAVEAAEMLGLPVLLKPNVGGSGAHVADCLKEIPDAKTAQNVLAQSADGVALVQEYKEPDDETTYRVQMIGNDHVYSLRAIGSSLNRCPRQLDCDPGEASPEEGCTSSVEFEAHVENPTVLKEVRKIVKAAGLDTCGIEYLISNGVRYYFDINALSNIVDDPKTKFKDFKDFEDPTDRFVKYIKKRLMLAPSSRVRRPKNQRI